MISPGQAMADIAVPSPTSKAAPGQSDQTLSTGPVNASVGSENGFIAQVSSNPFFSAVSRQALLLLFLC